MRVRVRKGKRKKAGLGARTARGHSVDLTMIIVMKTCAL